MRCTKTRWCENLSRAQKLLPVKLKYDNFDGPDSKFKMNEAAKDLRLIAGIIQIEQPPEILIGEVIEINVEKVTVEKLPVKYSRSEI